LRTDFFKAERDDKKVGFQTTVKYFCRSRKDTVDRPGQILPSWFTRICAPLHIQNMGMGINFQLYGNWILVSTPLHCLRWNIPQSWTIEQTFCRPQNHLIIIKLWPLMVLQNMLQINFQYQKNYYALIQNACRLISILKKGSNTLFLGHAQWNTLSSNLKNTLYSWS